MPISALVLTLSDNPNECQRALRTLHADARMIVGDLQAGNRLPVVLETASIHEGIRVVDQELQQAAGVQFVDVVSVDFSDVEPGDERLPPRRRRQQSDVQE